MHQDIIDALNLAGRRRGYDDGGMVADEMMSDDPTQQFMANLARAGFSQDQINSIIGSQSPQTSQTPDQAPQASMPPSTGNQPSDNPFGLQSYPPNYYPGGGQPDYGPPPGSIAVDQGGPWGHFGPPQLDYPSQQMDEGYGYGQGDHIPMPPRPQPFYPGEGSGIYPHQGDGGANFGINWGTPGGPGGLGGTGTKAGGSAPMGGGAPIHGAYGNPQYAPLGGGSKAGGPASPFAPNMPGGYGAPPPGYFPHRDGGGNPYGGAGHKGGGAGHKGGGGGGMFGG